MTDLNPDQTSSDYAAMAPYWAMVDAILDGVEALRAGRERYLPRFPKETPADYAIRVATTPLTNLYDDTSRTLASKPFSREVALVDGSASPRIAGLVEDIDGRGNHLHVLARQAFKAGIDKGVDWILVDYTRVPPGATLDDERRLGARPYWLRVPVERLLAVYSDFVGGREIIVHARIREDLTVRDGWGEATRTRVRVFDRPRNEDGSYGRAVFQIWELSDEDGKEGGWRVIEEGPVTIGVIPLVPFVTGDRQEGSWRVQAPLRHLAHLQIEEFQQESNLKWVQALTCYPMLAANGVPGIDESGKAITVPVGPAAVLFAPPYSTGQGMAHGEWKFVEPTAESIKTLMEHLDGTRRQMKELGMQPLLPRTGNLTATATGIQAAKAHSAAQAWALALKDALEWALALTARWLGDPSQPEVSIHTDFGIELEAGEELRTLTTARQGREISRETYWTELKRRNVLSEEFDPDIEAARLEAEAMTGFDAAENPEDERVAA